ncbi:MAG: hypothetical protein J0M24_19045 [Verrucomicrobia bacterium]|nr:hypothetical protein [Verrucomicrobiota bacterium]
MKAISTAWALGILSGGAFFAASSFAEDLPLIPLPASRLGPVDVRYELVAPPVSDAQTLPEAFYPAQIVEFKKVQLPLVQASPKPKPDDILQPRSSLAPPAWESPGPTSYFGLVSGFESATSLFYPPRLQNPSGLPGNANNVLGRFVGLAIYGFGVFAVYRGIQRAQNQLRAES